MSSPATSDLSYEHPCKPCAGAFCCDDDCMNYKTKAGRDCWNLVCCPCVFPIHMVIAGTYGCTARCCCNCCGRYDTDQMMHGVIKRIDCTLMACVPCCISKNRFEVMEHCVESRQYYKSFQESLQ